jgi:hypothetical protein
VIFTGAPAAAGVLVAAAVLVVVGVLDVVVEEDDVAAEDAVPVAALPDDELLLPHPTASRATEATARSRDSLRKTTHLPVAENDCTAGYPSCRQRTANRTCR